MHDLVLSEGACALPGVSIAPDILLPLMYRAVARGFVSQIQAFYVHQGLRWGFDLGFSPAKLPGRRFFKNYKSATDAHVEVSKNIHGRLRDEKSYALFPFDPATFREDLSSFLPSWCVFPLGAVPKPSEPGSFRPISDHSRTGFNDASCDDHLRHSLRTVPEIGRFLAKSYHMAVHDIDAAFPLLPLSPVLWPFFLFVWTTPPSVSEEEVSDSNGEWLCWHVCGDFGAKGLPGTFKIVFADVIMGIARSEGALTSPCVVHVDDISIIDFFKEIVDGQASALASLLKRLGTPVKDKKHRPASRRQFVVGFWWDSVLRTRTLDEQKVLDYVAMFSEFASRRSLSLREIQSVAGRLQRAVLTLPPGASCLLANLFPLMRGLAKPCDKRRVPSSSRRDLLSAASLLSLNHGRGFFSYDQFGSAPPVYTDASKSSRYVGGGYLSSCGRYSFWRYGSSASRKPIDTLEGDTVVRAARDLGHLWKKKVVTFFIDNQAFQASAVKGWSRAARLSDLIRQLFFIAISCECIFVFEWISTHHNVFADALSRPEPLSAFLKLISARRHFFSDEFELRQHPTAGVVKCLEVPPSALPSSLDGWPSEFPGAITSFDFGSAFSSDVTGDGPKGGRSAPVAFSVTYPRASIFIGLPSESVRVSVEAIVSDRLSESSHSSISAALTHWDVVVRRHVWPRLIAADDPMRGGKLATFVSFLVHETELKATSISNYVWALRQYFKFQHLPDPVMGVLDWDDFMQSVDVVAWVAREPRKPVPLSVLRRALEAVDLSVFSEVQAALLIVFLFFTFARSESPCPKSFSGKGSFDPTKHLEVQDLEVRTHEGSAFVALRLKSIKQDPRMERTAGNDDWIFIGDVPGVFSVLTWLSRFWAFFPADGTSPPRPPDSPFFRDSNGERVLTYTNAMDDTRKLYAKVAPSSEVSTYGLHGIRVEAYNRARAHDPLLAVAQGGWSSECHERYARFYTSDVLALAGAMVAGESQSSGGGGFARAFPREMCEELPIPHSSGRRLGRARQRAASSSTEQRAAAPSVAAVLPAPSGTRSRPGKSRGGSGSGGVALAASPSPSRRAATLGASSNSAPQRSRRGKGRARVGASSPALALPSPPHASLGVGGDPLGVLISDAPSSPAWAPAHPLPSERLPSSLSLPSRLVLRERAAAFSGHYQV